MAVAYNRYKFVTVSLPKRLCNGRFRSETASWTQKWFKISVGTSRKLFILLGWPCSRAKAQGPWHKGACFNFLPSFGGAFYTKSAKRPRQVPGQFPNRLGVIQKNASDWF
jgi:hypothetical protein